MTEPSAGTGAAPASKGVSENPAAGAERGLDDVMIAMDVVDTLRQDDRILQRELDDAGRRDKLIDRLREIYHQQGIEVPDNILEEGVRALEEKRFQYDPPSKNLKRTLAEFYVTRMSWGRNVGAGLAVLALVYGFWYVAIERPRKLQVVAVETELREALPQQLQSLSNSVIDETDDAKVELDAVQIRDDGLKAAAAGQIEPARQARAKLESLLATLREDYVIRVVTRRGTLSGLWRVPKVNPDAQNYYLVVEAVGPSGTIVPQMITSEETGATEKVTTWAVRVPKAVLDRVQQDKNDDGIIQNAVVATKPRGVREPEWLVETSGGAITKW